MRACLGEVLRAPAPSLYVFVPTRERAVCLVYFSLVCCGAHCWGVENYVESKDETTLQGASCKLAAVDQCASIHTESDDCRTTIVICNRCEAK